MYLKSLQMIGFKSFSEKTGIEFLPGVTAIVGPNGCGKSNVSDAIRWVLGEQSAKALRGDEMADVIFNGTDSRKALGMAEVNLTFADCRDILQTGKLAGTEINFDEVTVTRRIFRDGNSEYLINKIPCRLKDMHSLFMDTGIGRSSYSIMEQGKIDKILSSHPEDRRSIFEEAAGITKFKAQKKEALRKLEYTEANLVRVSDIIREVKRQIGSLQRQAGKARRYQALSSEMKHLDVQLARHQLEQIQQFMKRLEDESNDLKTRIEDIRLEIEAGEGNIINLREQVTGAEVRRQQILQRHRELLSEVERFELRVHTNTDRMGETQAVIQVSEKEAVEAGERLTTVERKQEAARLSLQAFEETVRQQTGDLERSQETLQQAEGLVREHAALIQRLQGGLLNLEGTLANLRNQTATLDQQRQEIGFRMQKLKGERLVVTEEHQKLFQRLESLQTEIASFKHTFEASRHAVTGGEEALREAENQCQTLGGTIVAEQRTISEKQARRDVLNQLYESYEGYSEGTQALLRWINEEKGNGDPKVWCESVLGSLANLIEVEPTFSVAVEAALGQALEAIVVRGPQNVFRLVDQLHLREWGQATLAVMDPDLHELARVPYSSEHVFGALAWARKVVRPQASVASLVSKLLADTVIVDSLAAAFRIHEEHPSLTCVTLHGDVLDGRGILTVGLSKTAPVQLIGRRNEMAALEMEIVQGQASLHQLSASKGEWEGRVALARQALGNRQSEMRFQENDLTRKEALLGAMQNELRDQESRLSILSGEIRGLDEERLKNESNQERIRQELVEAEKNQSRTETDFSEARRKASELEENRHGCTEKSHDLRVARATTEQQIHGLQSQMTALEIQRDELRQLVGSRQSDILAGRQRIAQWEAENSQATQRITVLREELGGINQQLDGVEAEKRRMEGEIQTSNENLRAHRSRVDEIQRNLTDYEVQLTEKRGHLTNLTDRIAREHSIDLNSIQLLPLQGDDTAVPADAGEAHAMDALEPEEGEPDVEGSVLGAQPAVLTQRAPLLSFSSWDKVSSRVTELREKIQGMGPVNLEAAQEYDELEQRFEFLNREFNDLTLSKEQLHQILQKISRTTREMFSETFEKIRQNFQSTFSELFGGGKADLSLMDEQDLLECGIEIVARPPGKKLQSISLLSGGEKTLTAVSLLFAIYMVKPSPFCVLDEMDAPLDDSNISRFVKMLERFLAHSQFVIITHNKRTIAMADAIYGVTMQERGVSNVISAKFSPNPDRRQPSSESNGENGNGTHTPPAEGQESPHTEISIAEAIAPASN